MTKQEEQLQYVKCRQKRNPFASPRLPLVGLPRKRNEPNNNKEKDADITKIE